MASSNSNDEPIWAWWGWLHCLSPSFLERNSKASSMEMYLLDPQIFAVSFCQSLPGRTGRAHHCLTKTTPWLVWSRFARTGSTPLPQQKISLTFPVPVFPGPWIPSEVHPFLLLFMLSGVARKGSGLEIWMPGLLRADLWNVKYFREMRALKGYRKPWTLPIRSLWPKGVKDK